MSHLLQQAVYTALVASLEQSGDGQGGNAAILVRNEALHVNVAVGHSHGVRHGHFVQGAHGSKPAHKQTPEGVKLCAAQRSRCVQPVRDTHCQHVAANVIGLSRSYMLFAYAARASLKNKHRAIERATCWLPT